MRKKTVHFLKRLHRDSGGGPAIEYASIAAAIVVIPIIGLTYLGGGLSNTFTTVSEYIGGSSSDNSEAVVANNNVAASDSGGSSSSSS